MYQSVIIIRKQNESYSYETINTSVVLPGCKLSDEQNRQNTISRLREDPSVVFVLDTFEGPYTETAVLNDGFEISLSLDEGNTPSASIVVLLNGNVEFRREYSPEDDDYEDFIDQFMGDCTWILECINRKIYYFAEEGSPLYPKTENKPIEINHIEQMLNEKGFQYERISTVENEQIRPLLFVFENEVALIGSRHFEGKNHFVELKRYFDVSSYNDVENAVSRVRHDYHPSIMTINQCSDGSWSFRMHLQPSWPEREFLTKMLSCIKELRLAIKRVEIELQYFPEVSYNMYISRHYFIYETLDASLKLSRLII